MNNLEPRLDGQFVWPVGALCRQIAVALEQNFNPVNVKGEVAGFVRAASGHCYFTLKDVHGQLKCAMFRRVGSGLNFVPSEGELVEITGRLGVYEPRGELQLIVERVLKAGQGDLFERFVRLKAKLEEEGLFAESRKRVPSSMPCGIGVVTSLGAAAWRDVAITLQRRAPNVPVYISPSGVQGDSAPKELASALETLYRFAASVDEQGQRRLDTILLVRGGGAMEDLWAFNDEELARTIARSPVPVICGVGHESDFTIADFVSDLRAATPTAAAEMACASASELWGECSRLHARVVRSARNELDRHAQRVDAIGLRVGRRSAASNDRKLELNRLHQRLSQSIATALGSKNSSLQTERRALQTWLQQGLECQKQRLQLSAIRLKLLDPLAVLDRGYAMLQSETGGVLGSIHQLQAGQNVRAILADGRADLKVLGKF
jgi:exodeoxyribonuclease VII large subunit